MNGRRSWVWAQSSSLARSEVPITRPSMRGVDSAMRCDSRILRGVSIIAQIVIESGAPLARMIDSMCRMASALSTLGSSKASAPDFDAMAMSS